MKTTLMDMVKVNPTSKGIEMQKNSNTRNADSTQNEAGWKETANTFTRALKKQEATQTEPASEQSAQNLSNQKPSDSESVAGYSGGKTEKIADAGKNHENGTVQTEYEDAQDVDLDAVTLSAAVQQMQQEAQSEMPIVKEIGETQTQSKIATLLSLLSAKTHLKVPKLEQYVSALRDAGKSAQEILDTLNTVLEEVDGKKTVSLKEFILLIVNPEKESKDHSEKGESPDQNETLSIGKATVNPLNTETEFEADKQPKEEGAVQDNPEAIVGKRAAAVDEKQSNADHKLNSDEGKSDDSKKTVNSNLFLESPKDQKGDQIPVLETTGDSKSEEAENTTLLGEMIRRFVNRATADTIQKGSDNPEQSDYLPNELDFKGISEELAEVLSERLNVSKEELLTLFNTSFASDEKLATFLQSMPMDSSEEVLKNAPEFIKNLFQSQREPMTTTLQFKSVKVKTDIIIDFIQKGFELKTLTKNLSFSGDNILLKYKEKTYTVEKMAVRFVKQTVEQSRETHIRTMESDSRRSFPKEGTTMNRFYQQSFKEGYENANRRMMDLSRFQEKTNQPVQDKNVINPGNEKAGKETTFNPLSAKEEHKGLFLENEEKETKKANKSSESDAGVHQENAKTAKGSTNQLLKGELVNQSRNIEQVYQKIKDMTQLMARQQTRTELATIRLNPPELGRVSLEMVKEGNKISIVMQVETKEAQDILNKNSNLLVARLVNSGFEVQKVTVQMEKYEEQGDQQTPQNDQEGSNRQKGNHQDSNNDSEYIFEEDYSFEDLLRGGIEEHAN